MILEVQVASCLDTQKRGLSISSVVTPQYSRSGLSQSICHNGQNGSMSGQEEKQERAMHEYGDCSFCGGEVHEEVVELDYRYQGKLYIFRSVPAGVCQQCGEKYLVSSTAKAIEHDIRTKNSWRETVAVPVKTFAAVSAP